MEPRCQRAGQPAERQVRAGPAQRPPCCAPLLCSALLFSPLLSSVLLPGCGSGGAGPVPVPSSAPTPSPSCPVPRRGAQCRGAPSPRRSALLMYFFCFVLEGRL